MGLEGGSDILENQTAYRSLPIRGALPKEEFVVIAKMVNHFIFTLFTEGVCKAKEISEAMFSTLRDENIFNH